MKKRFNYLICLCLFAPTLVSAQADSMYSDTEELVTPGSEIIQSYDDTVVGDTATDYSAIPAALLALDLKKKEYCVTLELDACNADGDYRCKRPTAGRNHERPWNSEMTECMKDRIQDDVAGDAVEECKEGQVPEFRFFEDFKESKYTLKCYGEGANDKISEFETTLCYRCVDEKVDDPSGESSLEVQAELMCESEVASSNEDSNVGALGGLW